MVESNPVRSELTFSQAEGIDQLPRPLALEELPEDVRNLLWNCVYNNLKAASRRPGHPGYIVGAWGTILHDFHVDFLCKPADEFNNSFAHQTNQIKRLFQKEPYNQVFDFLQFILRHDRAPSEFCGVVQSILKDRQCAYMVIDDGPSIASIATPEQGESIEQSFQVLALGPFDGARTHLRESAQCINVGDYAGSVRESIHAVESAARNLSRDADISLTPALNALSEKGVILHGAFKSGVKKLYGYSSDENGIRHSLLEGDGANVDVEDAVFMFGACASFAAYLVNKARRAGLITK